MYEEIISLLRCPNCKESLFLKESVLENSEMIKGKLKCKYDEIWENCFIWTCKCCQK